MDGALIRNEYESRCANWSDIVDHLPRLHSEAARPNVTVIELGVRSGNSTAAFLLAAEEHDGTVWSVDVNTPNVPWWTHDRWTMVVGDDLDAEIQADLPALADVVFIDTTHAYTQTLNELHAFWPRVKPGGVMLLHDTELDHPDASPPDDPMFPVRAAIDEWLQSAVGVAETEFVTGCYGLGVIRRVE
jgi:predicted O-methyltransferase YrrM